MTLSMYHASVPVFRHQLSSLATILTKAEAYATERKIDQSIFIQARLSPDMLPMGAQVQIASDAAKGAIARLAGVDIPSFKDTETTFAELGERCARTIEFIDGFSADRIDGSEDKQIVMTMRGTAVTFLGQQFLLGFAMPNFYFHVTTAYAILRHNGVPIGKRDFLGVV
jgi:hypothetical protein